VCHREIGPSHQIVCADCVGIGAKIQTSFCREMRDFGKPLSWPLRCGDRSPGVRHGAYVKRRKDGGPIIGVFPPSNQNKIRQTLSRPLKGVVAQTLFKRIDKKGRIAAFEFWFHTAVAISCARPNASDSGHDFFQVGRKIGTSH